MASCFFPKQRPMRQRMKNHVKNTRARITLCIFSTVDSELTCRVLSLSSRTSVDQRVPSAVAPPHRNKSTIYLCVQQPHALVDGLSWPACSPDLVLEGFHQKKSCANARRWNDNFSELRSRNSHASTLSDFAEKNIRHQLQLDTHT